MSRHPLLNLPWAISIGLQAAPFETPVRLFTLIIRFSGPALVLLMLQRVIGAVAAGEGLAWPLASLAAACVLTEVSTAVSKNFDTRIQEKMEPYLQQMVLERAAALSLEQYEEPAVHDLIERVSRGNGACVYEFMTDVFWTLGVLCGGLSSLAVLLHSSPWAALAGCLAAVPAAWAGVRSGSRMHQLERYQTPARRFTNYLGGLLATREPAAELRAYGLAGHFLERWRSAFARRREEHLSVRWQGVWEGWLAGVITVLLYGASLAGLAVMARQGRVGAGDFVVIAGAMRLLQSSMTSTAGMTGHLWKLALPVVEMRRFLAIPRVSNPGRRPFPVPLAAPIRFEQVSFTYPGAQRPVLDGLTMSIEPGESIALVGINGAGKSTLVKLLLGLYRPTSGRITVGGVDLAEIDPADLHRNMSCVFQDFMRYDMTLGDNIRFGQLDANAAQVDHAVQSARLGSLVASLPQGLDNLLGKTFAGGTELSGGQWQRVAMARAFVRTAQVILLDEPTAALDPRAELEVFGQFLELVEGKTAILISHRLGSARLAQRIVVLGEGRVVEEGNHSELMTAGGHYARLFQMQAQWYEDEAPAPVSAEEVLPV